MPLLAGAVPGEPAWGMCPLAPELGEQALWSLCCQAISRKRALPSVKAAPPWGRNEYVGKTIPKKFKEIRKRSYRVSLALLDLFSIRAVANIYWAPTMCPTMLCSGGYKGEPNVCHLGIPRVAPWWPGRGNAAFQGDMYCGEKRTRVGTTALSRGTGGRREAVQASEAPS